VDDRPRKGSGVRTRSTPSADDAALGVVVTTARLAAGAARMLTWAPGVRPLLQRSAKTGRAARERGRERIEQAAQTALSAPEVGRLVDGALSGPLPEKVARSSVEHHVGDRLAAELEVERARLMESVLTSPEFEQAMERALSSPAVRTALANQTTSVATEIAADVHTRSVALDRKLALGRARSAEQYAGLASRTSAFVADLVLAQIPYLVCAAVVALVASFVGTLREAWLAGTLAGAGWFVFVGAYFVLFWTSGRTPAMRFVGLRVADAHGRPPSALRATARFVVLLLATLISVVPILFERRRRGLHDLVAGTTVLYDDKPFIHGG
jgi:uncharacterized RDD family membrane protein YckC